MIVPSCVREELIGFATVFVCLDIAKQCKKDNYCTNLFQSIIPLERHAIKAT